MYFFSILGLDGSFPNYLGPSGIPLGGPRGGIKVGVQRESFSDHYSEQLKKRHPVKYLCLSIHFLRELQNCSPETMKPAQRDFLEAMLKIFKEGTGTDAFLVCQGFRKPVHTTVLMARCFIVVFGPVQEYLTPSATYMIQE